LSYGVNYLGLEKYDLEKNAFKVLSTINTQFLYLYLISG